MANYIFYFYLELEAILSCNSINSIDLNLISK